MPTYQYACTECGHGFEAVQSFTDDALTECPQCTGRLRKVFNSVGIVFKGSGFYRTDSREKAGRAARARTARRTRRQGPPTAAKADGKKSDGRGDRTSRRPAAGSARLERTASGSTARRRRRRGVVGLEPLQRVVHVGQRRLTADAGCGRRPGGRLPRRYAPAP